MSTIDLDKAKAWQATKDAHYQAGYHDAAGCHSFDSQGNGRDTCYTLERCYFNGWLAGKKALVGRGK